MPSPPPIDTSDIRVLGYYKHKTYSPVSPAIWNDSFDTFDQNVWALYGNASAQSGYIRLTTNTFNIWGQLERKTGISGYKWKNTATLRLTSDVLNDPYGYFVIYFYADSIPTPTVAFAVFICYNYGDMGSSVIIAKNDINNRLVKASYSFACGTYTIELVYLDGNLYVLINGAFVAGTYVGKTNYSKFSYGAGKGNEYTHYNYYTDILDSKQESLTVESEPTITLSDTLPAYESYTQYGNYIDGTVRVWDSIAVGAFSPYRGIDGERGWGQDNYDFSDHGDTYEDINVRVRADGWVLAWLTRSQNFARLLWWSRNMSVSLPRDAKIPVEYHTRLMHAVELILNAANIWAPNFMTTDMNYYDYEHPAANKIIVFGPNTQYLYAGHEVPVLKYYYLTIPNGVTVYQAWLTWIARFLNHVWPNLPLGVMYYKLDASVDGVYKYQYQYYSQDGFDVCFISGGGGNHPNNVDITSMMTNGVQHTFIQRTWNYGTSEPYTDMIVVRAVQAILIETS
jgi:hypothetical protein